MATVTSQKVRVNLKLNDGTTSSGATKYVSIPLGSMNKDAFDANKVMAIALLLSSVLEKGIMIVEKVETSNILE